MNKFFGVIFFLIVSISTSSAIPLPVNVAMPEYIKSLAEKVKSENRYTGNFSDMNFATTPIAIKKEIGGIEYTIIIDSVSLGINGGRLVAYMSLEVPGTPLFLTFRAGEIAFNSGGIVPGAGMRLTGKAKMPFGNKMNLFLKDGLDGCKVNFDCDGFQGMELKGELKLDSSTFKPENSNGELLEGAVKASFSANISEWSELMASVSLPRFRVEGLKGFSFEVQNASFDMSDVSNPAGILFPQGYDMSIYNGISNLWQGVYIKNVTVTLPNELKNKENVRPQITATNMIIDDMGFSGNFKGKNLVTLEKGRLGNWAFSLDSVKINVVSSKITEGKLGGKIRLPITKSEQLFSYGATIDIDNNYFFTVQNQQTLDFSLWSATANIDPNSSLDLIITNGQILPSATLHGRVNVNVPGGKTSLANIRFEGLTLRTVAPVITVNSFDLGSDLLQSKLSSFPISIKSVGLEFPVPPLSVGNLPSNYSISVGLSINLDLNLVGTSDGGFGAGGKFTVFGNGSANSNGEFTYSYGYATTGALRINIDNHAFKIKGEIKQYQNDVVYGDGFKGTVEAIFTPGIVVSATAQFGNVNGLRYWYVDGLLGLPTGIAVFPGVGIYGFGGGAYFKMRPTYTAQKPLPQSASTAEDNTSLAGRSLSGVTYIPDPTMGIGIRAKIIFATMPTAKTFNGDIAFEISFLATGALNKISLTGNGYIMEDIYKGSPASPIRANVYIEYDNMNKVLLGNVSAAANINNVLKGSGPNNEIGKIDFYFSSEKWHIFAGTPENRLGVDLLGMFTIRAYMMAGMDIPGMPSPPERMLELMSKYTPPDRNDISLQKGNGFAFGASLEMDTGEKEFLIFYGRLSLGAGFDIMLKDYGAATCVETGKIVGINGWYASGQLYAYGAAKVGIKVDLALIKGRFEIMNASLAMLLQAKAPNPTWVKGDVEGRYSILNGIIKGSFDFSVEMGKTCTINNSNPLQGFSVITDCSPKSGENDVDVFANPQASFLIAPGAEFQLKDNSEKLRTFRVKFNHFRITADNTTISGTQNFNEDGDVVSLVPDEILPGKKQLKLTVKITFEEKINQTWEVVKYNGADLTESKELSFTTGVAPDYIPEKNVVYSYPLKDQFNFYKNEYTNGYIQLKQGQSYLLLQSDNWNYTGKLEKGGVKSNFTFQYDPANKRVNYTMPSNMELSSIYKLALYKIPKQAQNSVDKNAVTSVNNATSSNSNSANVQQTKLEGTLSNQQENKVFDLYFRTSAYNTFSDKWKQMIANTFSWSLSIHNGIDQMKITMRNHEILDDYELNGDDNFTRLVNFEANFEKTNNWISRVKDNVYKDYPIEPSVVIDHRTISELGNPPLKAIFHDQTGIITRRLQSSEYNGAVGKHESSLSFFTYNLCHECYKDHSTLVSKSLSEALYSKVPALNRYISFTFPNLLVGNPYYYSVFYQRPGDSPKLINENYFSYK